MLTKLKWAFYILAALFVILFFHYSLPSRDVVQIVGTEVKRIDVGENSWFWAAKDAGTNATDTRDVSFINARYENGDPRVYRNEDTSWGWPPYLKFDTGNLHAQAQGFEKQPETWVAVSHYGWRIPLISLYPNAYKIKEVAGPDVRLIPWFNIIFLIFVALLAWGIFVRVRRWKDRNVDPYLEDIGEAYDGVSDSVTQTKGRFSRWLDTWRDKKKPR